MPPRHKPSFDQSLLITAAPSRVISAFFDPVSLASWWQATRSVTTPRPLGAYAIEWEPTEFRDDLLGPLGGVFRGTVMEFNPGREFFVADAYWLPPEGDPIGPMALEVTCTLQKPARPTLHARTLLRVTQKGYEESERWTRYYEVISLGWQRALASLKRYLEQEERGDRGR